MYIHHKVSRWFRGIVFDETVYCRMHNTCHIRRTWLHNRALIRTRVKNTQSRDVHPTVMPVYLPQSDDFRRPIPSLPSRLILSPRNKGLRLPCTYSLLFCGGGVSCTMTIPLLISGHSPLRSKLEILRRHHPWSFSGKVGGRFLSTVFLLFSLIPPFREVKEKGPNPKWRRGYYDLSGWEKMCTDGVALCTDRWPNG